MNAAHLHIALVHFPVVLAPVGLFTLLVGIRLTNRSVQGVALSILVLAAIVAVPAFLLGEGAEELVEHLPGISEQVIEEHEEVATAAFWSITVVGILSLATLVGLWRMASWARVARLSVIVAAMWASAALFYAAYQGGAIRHPEAYTAGASEGR